MAHALLRDARRTTHRCALGRAPRHGPASPQNSLNGAAQRRACLSGRQPWLVTTWRRGHQRRFDIFSPTCKNGQEPAGGPCYGRVVANTLQDMLPLLARLSGARGARTSLADLAKQAGKSPSTLQRAFSRIVGESPKQYTRRLQLECAAVLLLTTEDTVLDIALAAGFDSHEGFTRAFTAHFDRPPKQFRREGAAAGLTKDPGHADLITQVGPCLKLFRAPLTPQGQSTMNYDITTQKIEAATYLCQSARCQPAEIADMLGKLLPAVFGHATKAGIEMVGPPTTLYLSWSPGMVEIKAGMPVAAGAAGTEDIEALTFEAGEAITTIHTGSYDGLSDAHATMDVFLHENGLKPAGPMREVYLTDPGDVPNPDEWKTQLIWPVAPA